MQLQTQTRPKVLSVLVLNDRIDAASAIQFKEQMRDLTQSAGPRVVLDLGRVQFLDSSGLGAIVAVRKLLAPDRVLELSSLTPTVRTTSPPDAQMAKATASTIECVTRIGSTANEPAS